MWLNFQSFSFLFGTVMKSNWFQPQPCFWVCRDMLYFAEGRKGQTHLVRLLQGLDPQSMMTSVPSCRGKSALSGTWTTYFLGLYSSFDYVLREIKRGLIMVNPCNAHAGTWSPFDLPVSLPDDLLQAHLNEYARLTRSPKVKHGQKPCYVR